MKKLFALLLAVLMCLSLAACSGGGETPAEPAPAEEPAAETSGETFEELLAAGIANGNKLTIYSTHSVTVSALEAFHNKYCPDVECEGTQVGDTEQVTQVAQEVKEGVLGADIIFIQDGARVLTDLVDEGYVYNWYNDATAQPNNQSGITATRSSCTTMAAKTPSTKATSRTSGLRQILQTRVHSG